MIMDFNMLIALHPPPSQCGLLLPPYFCGIKCGVHDLRELLIILRHILFCLLSSGGAHCLSQQYFARFVLWGNTVTLQMSLDTPYWAVMLARFCFFLFEYLSQSDRERECLYFVFVCLCEIVSFLFGFVAAMMGLMAWFLCDRRWTKDQNRRQFRVEILSEEWTYDAIVCRCPLLTLFDSLRDVDAFCNVKNMNLIGFVNVLWSVPPQSDRMGICLIGFAVCDAVDCGVGYFSVLRWFDWLFVLHFFAISVCFLKSALIDISEGVRF